MLCEEAAWKVREKVGIEGILKGAGTRISRKSHRGREKFQNRTDN
jgi:hypothetical protein